jgi:uncharacterized protein YndB with AHSA1/START domain
MARKLLAVIPALIAVFFIVVATRPATFEIKRELLINAPPEVVFAQVNDFKSWQAWSPWEKKDPTMKRTWGDVPAGVGASYHWVGNKDVGEGSMTIIDSKPGEHILLDLEFITPWAAKNRTAFDFAKTGAGTTVSWVMSGANGFGAKAMSMFMDMDKMVGPDFEQGLANLKTISEDAAKKAAAAAAQPPTDAAAVDAGTP